MTEATELSEFFEHAAVPVRFSRRRESIPGEFRTAWRLSVLALLLSRGRANSLALDHLHVLWWAVRSSKSRTLLRRWFDGERRPDELIVRFDPSLSRTVDLAQGQGLVSVQGGTVKLTAAGAGLAKLIASKADVLVDEKSFLGDLPNKITQKEVRQILEWK